MADTDTRSATRSAFDVLMGRVDFDARSYDACESEYGGFETENSWIAYEVACILDPQLHGEDIDPDISYDEFFERFWWTYGFVENMGEDEFEEYWTRGSWQSPRRLHSYESSYLRGSFVARRDSQLNYDHCKPAELKRFVNQRGLRDSYPEGVTLKYFYMPLLEKADRERTFRFMDLPPEMRLLVYQELLIFPRTGRKQCDTAILRISREVQMEASDVLYDGNIITCSFACTKDYDGRWIRSIRIHKDSVRGGCDHAPYIRIPEGINDYPEYLLRISRLRIEVEGEMQRDDDGPLDECVYPLNHGLYSLASFLMDNHRLKEVHIDARLDELDEFGETRLYESIFWPLRRLRNVQKVTMTGVPGAYQRKIIRDLTDVEPVFNTLKQWNLLYERAMAQLELLEAVYSVPLCTCGDCPLPEPVEEIVSQLALWEGEKLECCLNSVLEENFIARLARFRDVLAKMQVDRVEALAKDVKAKWDAWKEYGAVTDEGRLDEAAKIWKGKIDKEAMKYADDHEWSDDESIGETTAPTEERITEASSKPSSEL